MIIGGVGGVFRTGSSKVGYSETFFPIAVDTVSETSINSLISAARPIKTSTRVRVLNALGAWIDLGDVTYMSATANADGSGQASFTIANSRKWSVDGTENPNVLRPSYRQIQAITRITSGANVYENTIFSGTIETYSESHGQRNGTINISAKPFSQTAANRIIKGLPRATVYRKIYDECMASGLFAVGQFPVCFIPDNGDAITAFLTPTISLQQMIHQIATYPTQQVRTGGGLLVTYQSDVDQSDLVSTFSVDDDSAITLTRVIGGSTAYNTVVAQGYATGSGGTFLTTETVSDSTDVDLRGTVLDPMVYGSPDVYIEYNVEAAAAYIAENLRDRLTLQVRLNPWITPTTQLSVSSNRLYMTNKLARVDQVTHTISFGNATTTLSDVAVLE